jgi:hypothetical protein
VNKQTKGGDKSICDVCKCPIQNFFSFSVLYEQPTTTKKTAEKETKKQPKLRSSQKKKIFRSTKE